MTEGGSADSHYYDWVDQFDTFGLGKNMPIVAGKRIRFAAGAQSADGKFTMMRVPYPMGFFAEGTGRPHRRSARRLEGQGSWTTWGTRAPFHSEGQKEAMTSKVVN